MIRRAESDFVLFLDKDLLLAQRLEEEGCVLFNSASAISVCDNKAKTFYALSRNHIAVPETIVAPMTFPNVGYTDLEFLSDIEQSLGYPVVVKELCGSFGSGVFLAHDRAELERLVAEHRGGLLFQRFVAECSGRDIRVVVANGRVIAAMDRHNLSGDFRSNVALGASYAVHRVSPCEQKAAILAAAACGCTFAGVDLLDSERGTLVLEVNSNAHMRAVSDCTGKDAVLEICAEIRRVMNNR